MSATPSPEEPDRGPLAWFVRNGVAANLLMLFLLAAGAISAVSTTVEVFPEISADTVSVTVPYLGAAPAEVEQGVVLRVEEAVAGVEGVERIRSVSREGVGTVVAELDEGADVQRVLDDVKSAVDRIETFPSETEKPIVAETVLRRQVVSLVLHGDVPERTLKELADRVRDELTAKEGISQVDLAGVRDYELSVEVSEDALRRYGLTFQQVADAVRRSSLDLPGGSLETAGGEILVRTEGQRYRGSEFEDVVVLARPDGTRVRLGEVADVRDAFAETDTASRFEGRRAALVRVYRVGEQGALDIAEAVKEYVEELRGELPEGVSVSVWEDQSEILRSRLSLLLRNAAMGLALVFVSLTLFLAPRLAFWTTMGIPISFLGGMFLAPLFGVTVNMISLFAFIVVLGIVVDDAIVVGENVFGYLEEGMEPAAAAIRGVREMAVPVTFAVLTTMAAFAPLLFVEGTMGKFMGQIPIVVIAVLAVSLVEALVILPAHLGTRHGGPGLLARAFSPLLGLLDRLRHGCQSVLEAVVRGPYRWTVERAVEWRYLTVAAATVLLLLAGGYVAGGFLRFTFMPDVDADNVIARLTMPQGTPLAQTEAVAARLERAIREVAAEFDGERPPGAEPLIRHISSTVGEQPTSGGGGPSGGTQADSGSNLAEVNVELLPSAERGRSSAEIARRWRAAAGEVAGAKELTFTGSLFTSGEAVNVELSHRDLPALLEASERLKAALAEFPGVEEVSDSFLAGKQELELELAETGRAAGLTLEDLARQVRSAFYGAEAQRIQRGRDDVRVMVRYPEERRRSVEDLESMRVRLPDGTELPFRTVARARLGRGYATIERTDRRRVVSVTADVDERVANENDVNRALREDVLPALRGEFPGLGSSFEGQQREQQESMQSLARNFAIALLAIFALLAVPFRSYTQPLIVMSAIPFGLVGAVLGHVLLGLDLSLLSMFGIVALSGVVVNDSLIMIDLINRERGRGRELLAVVRESGMRRFRPILLTTLTTFLGLTPMILETSLQARFLIPMAVSLGFGVAFSTLITLVLVPALYMVLEDLHTFFLGRQRARELAHAKARELRGEGPAVS